MFFLYFLFTIMISLIFVLYESFIIFHFIFSSALIYAMKKKVEKIITIFQRYMIYVARIHTIRHTPIEHTFNVRTFQSLNWVFNVFLSTRYVLLLYLSKASSRNSWTSSTRLTCISTANTHRIGERWRMGGSKCYRMSACHLIKFSL